VSAAPKKSTEEKLRTVMSVVRGEMSLAEAGRRAGVSDMTVAKWRDRFLEGGKARSRAPKAPAVVASASSRPSSKR